jgi:hypothetical protein
MISGARRWIELDYFEYGFDEVEVAVNDTCEEEEDIVDKRSNDKHYW